MLFRLTIMFPLLAEATDSVQTVLVTRNLAFEPGRINHVVFRLTNLSASQQAIRGEFILPAGLRLAIPPADILLAPGESAIQMASFNIPIQFPAGKHSLNASFYLIGSGEQVFSSGIEFQVAVKQGLLFEFLKGDDYVTGGEIIHASYQLKNTGNKKQRFRIEPFNCNLTTPSQVELGPGEYSTVRVVASTGSEINKPLYYQFSVEAWLSEEVKKRDFRSVLVYPDKPEKSDLYLRFPVTLSTRYLARGRDGKYYQGYQLEASGSGYLDTGMKHKLEFMARGPNNLDLSFLGLYDEYYISYKNKHFESFVGNKSYNFTPLIESARYGFGTEQTFISKNGSRIGLLYVEPRFFKDIKNEMAAYADLSLRKGNAIGLHFLTKKNNPLLQQAYLGSVSTILKPFSGTSAEMEYSVGTMAGNSDDAYRIFLHSYQKRFSLSGSFFNTGKNYPGYYRNARFYSGNLNVTVTKALSLNLSAREDFTNAALDTLFGTAPYSNSLMASASYRINRNMNFRAYYLDYGRKDRMPVKQFDYHTTSMNGEFSHQLNKIQYRVEGEFGKTVNNLASPDGTVQQNSYRTRLNISYRPTYLFNTQAFVSYSNMNRFISANQENLLWGISAYGQLTKNLRTTFQVQNSYTIEEYYLNRNLFQFTLEYSFLKRHRISANSYYMLFQNETEKPDFTFSLTYSLQLGLPVRKTEAGGNVAGVLNGTNGKPLRGILFHLNGRTAITNENGGFSFNNLPAGKYQLLTSRDRLGFDETLNIPIPSDVVVHSAQTTRLILQVVRAASVKGRLTITKEAVPTQSPGEKAVTLGNVVIEIKDNLENIRIISNPDGTFEFPRLRPGKWILIVYKNNIDPGYSLVKESFEMVLEQGENRIINIELVPRTRKVVFKPAPALTLETSTGSKPNHNQDQRIQTPSVSESGIWFSVQVASAISPIWLNSGELKGVEDLFEHISDGRYRYFSGRFTSVRQARRHRDKLKNLIPGVFIEAFEGNVLLPLKDAIQKTRAETGTH